MNSFGAKSALTAGNTKYEYYSLELAEKSGAGSLANLPFSLKVMLENLLRFEDGSTVTTDDVRSVAIPFSPMRRKRNRFRPARVLMQDFTGVPAVVDLATMRDVIRKMGGDPKKINPLQQVIS
jgi:aconitate hydratase